MSKILDSLAKIAKIHQKNYFKMPFFYMQKQKKNEKLLKILKIRIYLFPAIFACRRDTYSKNCFDEFLKSSKNDFNDSERKVSKLKF